MDTTKRSFLMLQGPHGPFFARLGTMLERAGAQAWRIGVNAGDQFFWPNRASFIPFQSTLDNWAGFLGDVMAEKSITDLVLYGDTRPIHAQAVKLAKSRGITVHVFEEGYMRPYWVTYERGGSNGNSKLMTTTVAQMQNALENVNHDMDEAPSHWGNMFRHVCYSTLYHLNILLRNRAYRALPSHRSTPVAQEFAASLRGIILKPIFTAQRMRRTRRLIRSGHPYHVVLMQLEHDSAFVDHSPFGSMPEFMELVVKGFAQGAPKHHRLVFKAHPIEANRRPMAKILRALARKYDVQGRVKYIPGGKLAKLLDHARSAVTVNSTAAQQVLWRGLPLKIFGAAVYDKPEFVSTLPLPAFFAAPTRPDRAAYLAYRRYLLETSQIVGGYYSQSGRQQILRQVIDMMLAPGDPYATLAQGGLGPQTPRHPKILRVV